MKMMNMMMAATLLAGVIPASGAEPAAKQKVLPVPGEMFTVEGCQGHNYRSGFFECQELVDFVITRVGPPPRLPKVLLIGDSISGGYGAGVLKLLDGKAEMIKLGAVATYRINNEAFWHSSGTAKALDFGSAKACVADAIMKELAEVGKDSEKTEKN